MSETRDSPPAQPRAAPELEPCPFCPSGRLETCFRDAEIGAHNDAVVFHWVECDCGARGPEDRDKAEAERLWNTRAAPRATETGLTVEAALTELREMFPLPHDLRVALSDYGRVVTAEIYRDARLVGTGKTLDEAMTEPRAWAKSRAASEREGE